MQQPCFTIEGEVKNFGFHILGPIIQLELMLFDPSLPISTMVYKIISRMTSDFQHKILIRIDLPSHTLFDSIKAFQNCLKYLLFFLVTKKGSPFLHYHFAPPCFHNYIFLKRGANEGGQRGGELVNGTKKMLFVHNGTPNPKIPNTAL